MYPFHRCFVFLCWWKKKGKVRNSLFNRWWKKSWIINMYYLTVETVFSQAIPNLFVPGIATSTRCAARVLSALGW